MTTSTLNKRLDRLQSSGSHRGVLGFGDRMNKAFAEADAKNDELRRLGWADEEIKAKDDAELRELLARDKPETPFGKRLHKALEGLLDGAGNERIAALEAKP